MKKKPASKGNDITKTGYLLINEATLEERALQGDYTEEEIQKLVDSMPGWGCLIIKSTLLTEEEKKAL